MKIKVRAVTQARENKVVKLKANLFKVFTTKSPENNKANEAIIVLLARYFKVKKSQVFLLTGAKFKDKLFDILVSQK